MTRILRVACLAVISILLIVCSHNHALVLLLGLPCVLSLGTWQHSKRSLQARDDLDTACRCSRLDHKQLAYAQKLDEAQWARQRKGDMGQTPSLYRMTECPELEAEWIKARAPRLGLIVVEQNMVGLAMEMLARLLGKKTMARMDLPEHATEERSA